MTQLSSPFQMNIANIVSATWYDLMENKADPRTTDWFLMSSPVPTVIICLTYVYIVKVIVIFTQMYVALDEKHIRTISYELFRHS